MMFYKIIRLSGCKYSKISLCSLEFTLIILLMYLSYVKKSENAFFGLMALIKNQAQKFITNSNHKTHFIASPFKTLTTSAN